MSFCLGWLINDFKSTFKNSCRLLANCIWPWFARGHDRLATVQSGQKWTICQHSFGFRKMSPFALQVHLKQIRVQFLTWVTPPTSRIHSEVHIFVRFWKFWKFKYSRLQGHVTSRWFSGRQIFNLGWQKWWQLHIRFLIMVQLTQKPSFGRTKHKFYWNLACNTWRMRLITSGFAIWSRSRPDRTVRAFVRVWLRSWRCPSNFGSYWVKLK